MQLENKFTIEAPIEKAWEALNTPEMIEIGRAHV